MSPGSGSPGSGSNDSAPSWASTAAPDQPTVDTRSRELPTRIEGVVVQRLTTHADHRGALTPVIDARDSFWSEPIVYGYRFTILPGRIKGWAMHELQLDRYVYISGDVRVVLFDGRSDSPTTEALVEVHFTDRTPGLVCIPPGVWHAAQNWGAAEAHVLNLPTRAYDPDQPDKYRIDPHSGAIPFDWSLPDG